MVPALPWAPSSSVPPNSIPSGWTQQDTEMALATQGEQPTPPALDVPKNVEQLVPGGMGASIPSLGAPAPNLSYAKREEAEKSGRNGTLFNHPAFQKASSHPCRGPELHLPPRKGVTRSGQGGPGSSSRSPRGSNPPIPASATRSGLGPWAGDQEDRDGDIPHPCDPCPSPQPCG